MIKPKITIICGETGSGKTTLMTHLGIMALQDKERFRLMKNEIIKENKTRSTPLTVPKHPLFANYDIIIKRFRRSKVQAYRINPFNIGFYNKSVDVHNLPPYAVFCITEGQKYFDSHRSRDYPSWQSRMFEAHRHNGWDFYIDCQRYMLINLNIRELATFIEVVNREEKLDRYKRIISIKWTVRRFDSCYHLDKFKSSGEKDRSCYRLETITANYNVYDCFDSFLCKKYFKAGHDELDFDLFDNIDDEMPDNFYRRNKVSVKELDDAIKRSGYANT